MRANRDKCGFAGGGGGTADEKRVQMLGHVEEARAHGEIERVDMRRDAAAQEGDAVVVGREGEGRGLHFLLLEGRAVPAGAEHVLAHRHSGRGGGCRRERGRVGLVA